MYSTGMVPNPRISLRWIVCVIALLAPFAAVSSECVILLHGMVRTPSSMDKMAHALTDQGFAVANVGYPSRKLPVQKLAPIAIERGLSECPPDSAIHFVTHSLGGILVRYYLKDKNIPRLGRVVMLAPPNKGSEVVDNLKNVPGYRLLNGPAGLQLGTDENSIPATLGPVEYEVGIIAGTSSINLILSQFLPDPDDGKVSVENTKVSGMRDFIAVPHSHPFIMQAPAVIEQAISFIRTGKFVH